MFKRGKDGQKALKTSQNSISYCWAQHKVLRLGYNEKRITFIFQPSHNIIKVRIIVLGPKLTRAVHYLGSYIQHFKDMRSTLVNT